MIPNYRRDNSISASRYLGEICSKDPKHGRERYKRNNTCVACQKQRAKDARKTPAGRKKEAERKKEQRANDSVARKIMEQMEINTRLKAIELAKERFSDPLRWRECWEDAMKT